MTCKRCGDVGARFEDGRWQDCRHDAGPAKDDDIDRMLSVIKWETLSTAGLLAIVEATLRRLLAACQGVVERWREAVAARDRARNAHMLAAMERDAARADVHHALKERDGLRAEVTRLQTSVEGHIARADELLRERDEAVKALGRFGEALVSAGFPPGDRDVQLVNLRKLVEERNNLLIGVREADDALRLAAKEVHQLRGQVHMLRCEIAENASLYRAVKEERPRWVHATRSLHRHWKEAQAQAAAMRGALEPAAALEWRHDDGCHPSEGVHTEDCRARSKVLKAIRAALASDAGVKLAARMAALEKVAEAARSVVMHAVENQRLATIDRAIVEALADAILELDKAGGSHV